ncbi:MAG: CBS domain-containing protein [Candidatus Bathyarchaeia archaeon]
MRSNETHGREENSQDTSSRSTTDIIDYLGGGEKIRDNPAEIDEAIKLMKENNIGGLPVTDEESRVRAIITERDVSNLFVGKLSEK